MKSLIRFFRFSGKLSDHFAFKLNADERVEGDKK